MAVAAKDEAEYGMDASKINLRSTRYKMDKSPLAVGCKCHTCTQHTRAYVHHLLNTHEMLADVLLEVSHPRFRPRALVPASHGLLTGLDAGWIVLLISPGAWT